MRPLVAFLFSFERTLTSAILTVRTPLCEQCSSAILGKRGDSFLFPGVLASPTWGVSHLAGCPVARLRAAALAHGSGILHTARGPAFPLQRHRTGPRAQPFVASGIHASDLRDFFHSRLRLRSTPQRRLPHACR